MKRFFKKTLILIFGIILSYHNFCYADVIMGPNLVDSIGLLMVQVAVVVIIMSLFSIVILHFLNKDNKEEKIKENKNNIASAIIVIGIGIDAFFGFRNNLSLTVIPFVFSVIVLMMKAKKSDNTKLFYIIDIFLIILTLILELTLGNVSRGGISV